MKKIIFSLTLIALFCTAAFAQAPTTITVNGSLNIVSSTFSGTVALSGGITGSGTIATGALTPGASGFTGTFTITISGGTLTGTVTVPTSVITGSGNISLNVTGGTGTYAGATGSFASLTGTAALAGTSVTLTNYTGSGTIRTGGGTTNPVPTITDVLDAASYTKNIARGSIFVVKGSNLSAAGFTQLSFPLPQSSSNVRITFTPAGGGAATDAYLVYLYNQGGVNQLAGILPSTVAAGNYNVTVTNANGTSANFATQVVAQKPGIITAASNGNGLAVVQNFISQSQLDINRLTTFTSSGFTFSPAKPGQVLIVWMTGLGPLPSGTDNTASPAVDFNTSKRVRVLVGGREITPLYAGRAPGLAGADQINFILPSDTQTGCTVPFQVSVDNQLSNSTYIAIAATTAAAECVQPGLTAAQLRNLDAGGSMTYGTFGLTSISQTVPQLGTIKVNSIGGGFVRITGLQLDTSSQVQPTPNGACQVIRITGSTDQLANPITATFLDAGIVTLTGPAGSSLSNTTVTKDPATNSYGLSLGFEGAGIPSIPGQINASLVAGQYRLNGAGGTDVGQFNASVNLGAPLTITGGLPATVVRANGLPLAWSGGNSSDIVTIFGYAGTNSGTGANIVVDATAFTCTTTAGAGGFNVPASILTQLPAVSAAQVTAGSASGYLQVISTVNPTAGNGLFTAPLTAGGNIDAGIFTAATGIGNLPAYQ
jgi:uncharacterized protein (TIGR03437 family)